MQNNHSERSLSGEKNRSFSLPSAHSKSSQRLEDSKENNPPVEELDEMENPSEDEDDEEDDETEEGLEDDDEDTE